MYALEDGFDSARTLSAHQTLKLANYLSLRGLGSEYKSSQRDHDDENRRDRE